MHGLEQMMRLVGSWCQAALSGYGVDLEGISNGFALPTRRMPADAVLINEPGTIEPASVTAARKLTPFRRSKVDPPFGVCGKAILDSPRWGARREIDAL